MFLSAGLPYVWPTVFHNVFILVWRLLCNEYEVHILDREQVHNVMYDSGETDLPIRKIELCSTLFAITHHCNHYLCI